MASQSTLAVAVAVVVATVLCCAPFAEAVREWPAYRLAQFRSNGEPKGSRASSFNLQATSVDGNTIATAKRLLNRAAAIVRIEDATAELLTELLFERKVGALLLVLPRDLETASADLLAAWKVVEAELLDSDIPVPVYFAALDEELENVLTTVTSGLTDSNADLFQLTVAAGTPKPIPTLSLANLQGWLAGSAAAEEEEDIPTIAVVAYYDSFSAAPSMPGGADSNGSGVAAVMELARLFSGLYASARTQGRANMLFLLTSGGNFNFLGAEEWIKAAEPSLLESLSFVLCIDSIAAPGPLYLYSPKKETHRAVASIFSSFKDVAANYDIELSVVHKKVNLADPTTPWEHERFAMKRIPTATLTHLKEAPTAGLGRSGIFDTLPRADTAALTRNIEFVAEALGRVVYPEAAQALGKEPIFKDGGASVDPHAVRAWMSGFNRASRSVVALAKSDDNVVTTLYSRLRKLCTDVSRSTFKLEDDVLQFAAPEVATLSAAVVKPVLFDIYFSLTVFSYLGLLYAALSGSLTSMFGGKAKQS